MRPNTKLFFFETPSNPTLELVDIAAVCKLAKQIGAIVVVDNVFATPLLQRPLEHGADVVVYSATKHMDGQGRCLGGAVLGTKDYVNQSPAGIPAPDRPDHEPVQRLGHAQGPGDHAGARARAVGNGGEDRRSTSPATRT